MALNYQLQQRIREDEDEYAPDLSQPNGNIQPLRKNECYECGKVFARSDGLTRHLRTHTGEKPFLCPEDGCGVKFTTKSHLVAHARVHTGEKPFACQFPGCICKYARRESLKKHQLKHADPEFPYVCPFGTICRKNFRTKNDLTLHVAEKHPHLKDKLEDDRKTARKKGTEKEMSLDSKRKDSGKVKHLSKEKQIKRSEKEEREAKRRRQGSREETPDEKRKKRKLKLKASGSTSGSGTSSAEDDSSLSVESNALGLGRAYNVSASYHHFQAGGVESDGQYANLSVTSLEEEEQSGSRTTQQYYPYHHAGNNTGAGTLYKCSHQLTVRPITYINTNTNTSSNTHAMNNSNGHYHHQHSHNATNNNNSSNLYSSHFARASEQFCGATFRTHEELSAHRSIHVLGSPVAPQIQMTKEELQQLPEPYFQTYFDRPEPLVSTTSHTETETDEDADRADTGNEREGVASEESMDVLRRESLEMNDRRRESLEVNEMQRESIEMQRESIEMRRESFEMQRESIEMRRESFEMQRESIEMRRESLEINEMQRESIDMRRESLEINEMQRESIEMRRESLEINEVQRESIEMRRESLWMPQREIVISIEEIDERAVGEESGRRKQKQTDDENGQDADSASGEQLQRSGVPFEVEFDEKAVRAQHEEQSQEEMLVEENKQDRSCMGNDSPE